MIKSIFISSLAFIFVGCSQPTPCQIATDDDDVCVDKRETVLGHVSSLLGGSDE